MPNMSRVIWRDTYLISQQFIFFENGVEVILEALEFILTFLSESLGAYTILNQPLKTKNVSIHNKIAKNTEERDE